MKLKEQASTDTGKVSTTQIAASDPPIVDAPPTPRTAPLKEVQAGEVDWGKIREDFPILKRTVHGKPLVYLDSTATSQKPQVVLDAMDDYYRTTNANIHRGVYELSEVATDRYEMARAHWPLHQREEQPGDYLHPQRYRGYQPGGA